MVRLQRNWDLDKDDVQKMTTQLRQGIVDGKGEVQLSGEVECDEVYVTAGPKGNPDAVKKKDGWEGVTASKGVEVEVRLRKKNRQFSA